jgi:hypothetical protein
LPFHWRPGWWPTLDPIIKIGYSILESFLIQGWGTRI